MTLSETKYIKKLQKHLKKHFTQDEYNATFPNDEKIVMFPYLAQVLISKAPLLHEVKLNEVVLGLAEYSLLTHTNLITADFAKLIQNKYPSSIYLYQDLANHYDSETFHNYLFHRQIEPITPSEEVVQDFLNSSLSQNMSLSNGQSSDEIERFTHLKNHIHNIAKLFLTPVLKTDNYFESTNFVASLMQSQVGDYDEISEFHSQLIEFWEPVCKYYNTLKPQNFEELFEFNSSNPFHYHLKSFYINLSEESFNNNENQISATPWIYMLYLKNCESIINDSSNLDYIKYVFQKVLGTEHYSINLSGDKDLSNTDKIIQNSLLRSQLKQHMPTLSSSSCLINLDGDEATDKIQYNFYLNPYQAFRNLLQVASQDFEDFSELSEDILNNFQHQFEAPIVVDELFHNKRLSTISLIQRDIVKAEDLHEKTLEIGFNNKYDVKNPVHFMNSFFSLFHENKSINDYSIVEDYEKEKLAVLHLIYRIALYVYPEENQHLNYDSEDIFDVFLDDIHYLSKSDNQELVTIFENLKTDTPSAINSNNKLINYLETALQDLGKKETLDKEKITEVYIHLFERNLTLENPEKINQKVKSKKF